MVKEEEEKISTYGDGSTEFLWTKVRLNVRMCTKLEMETLSSRKNNLGTILLDGLLGSCRSGLLLSLLLLLLLLLLNNTN